MHKVRIIPDHLNAHSTEHPEVGGYFLLAREEWGELIALSPVSDMLY